ncbi:MAG: Smr/MutS family protein [Candidatus Aminicenantes bacterium]|nr:Smr/MutS family protein [Candidatus Aminicenantes bacterium]
MAIQCPDCGRQYDVTLFQFGQTVECDCGAIIEYGDDLPHSRPDPAAESLDPVELPIDGVLDLHAFHPAEVKELIPEYLDACREKGILRIRIVHGKGTGEMMKTVHALLGRLPGIASFELAGPHEGGSGATIVYLKE